MAHWSLISSLRTVVTLAGFPWTPGETALGGWAGVSRAGIISHPGVMEMQTLLSPPPQRTQITVLEKLRTEIIIQYVQIANHYKTYFYSHWGFGHLFLKGGVLFR